MDISYLTIGEKVNPPPKFRGAISAEFLLFVLASPVLQEVPAKFMVSVPGNGLSLVKYDTMTQVLLANLQFIR